MKGGHAYKFWKKHSEKTPKKKTQFGKEKVKTI